jgi:hypothetical protein
MRPASRGSWCTRGAHGVTARHRCRRRRPASARGMHRPIAAVLKVVGDAPGVVRVGRMHDGGRGHHLRIQRIDGSL